MDLEPAAASRIDIGKLPTFNGFPYLATRLASAVYHIRLLPAEWSRDAQWDFALRQAGANGLPVCLARDAERGEYFNPETGGTQIAGIRRAGILPPGELVAVERAGDGGGASGQPERDKVKMDTPAFTSRARPRTRTTASRLRGTRKYVDLVSRR